MLLPRASLRGLHGTLNPPLPLVSLAMKNLPSISTSQTWRREKAAWSSIDTRQVVEIQECGLGQGSSSQRLGRDVGFGMVFALTALCAGKQPGTEGSASQHQFLGACGAEPDNCMDRTRGLPPPGTQGLCMTPPLISFTWISYVHDEP